MARYIDADKAKELWSGEHPTQIAMRRIFDDLPTADVVPKSEVERLQEDVDRLNEINEGLVRELSELIKQIELDKRSQEIDKIVRRRLGDLL